MQNQYEFDSLFELWKPSKPMGKPDILSSRNRNPNIAKFIAKSDVQLTFPMESIQMYAMNQCEIDALFELWKSSKPIGKPDVLSARNHYPKRM